MIGRSLVMLLVVAAWACLAPGDIVYIRGGGRHEGTVRREGETVFVEIDDGEVVEIPADQVLYISTSSLADLPDEAADNGETAPPADDGTGETGDELVAPPPAPPASADDFTGGITPAAQTFSMDEATRPESIAFILMRQAAAAETPRQAREIARQVQQWQAAAHDRQRRVGGQWLRPGDFTRSRQRFGELLVEARKTAKELADVDDDDQDADEKRADLRGALNTKLLRVAGVWIDDDIRMFLTGIAHYQTESYSLAIQAFERCRNAHPIVSAYQQGHGLALMKMPDRELDALAAFLDELRLDPDNKLALLRVADAMENVPGTRIRDAWFTQAEEMVAQYPESAFRIKRKLVWHMPGEKDWSTKTGSLPVPLYDRLVYRQGIAVPIGSHTLLLDKEVLRDALAVFVLLDDGTIVPATILSQRSSDGVVPLALVRTNEATFQAVAVSEDAQFHTGSAVATYGLSIFPEMGTAPRRIVGKITAVPPEPADDDDGDDDAAEGLEGAIELDIALAPGESASPVLTGDKRLVGFLAGRTNFRRDNGGEDELIPFTDIVPLVEEARKSSSRSSSRIKRQFEPIATEATTFVVYCISSETLD